MAKALAVCVLSTAVVGCDVTFTPAPTTPDEAGAGTPMDQQSVDDDSPTNEDPGVDDVPDPPLDLNGAWRIGVGTDAFAAVIDDIITEWRPISANGESSEPIGIDDSLSAVRSDDAIEWEFRSPSTVFIINVVPQTDDLLIGSLTTRTGLVSTSFEITMTRQTEP